MNFLKYLPLVLIVVYNVGSHTYYDTDHGTYDSYSVGKFDYIMGPDGYYGMGYSVGNNYYYDDNDC